MRRKLLAFLLDFLGDSDSKESTCNAGDPGSISGWEELEKGLATHSSILLGESRGQRTLVGYSPWRCKEADRTE